MTPRKMILGLGLLLAGCDSLWSRYYKDCQQNASCPSSLCIDIALDSYPAGSCIPPEAVQYIDNIRCAAGAKTGQPDNPFCSLQDAIASIQHSDQTRHIFQLKPSLTPYPGGPITHGNLALFGPWADPVLKGTKWEQMPAATLQSNEDPGPGAALDIKTEAGAMVGLVVDGLAIAGNALGLGVNLDSRGGATELTLRRTIVSSSAGYGVNVSGLGQFSFTMDRCKVMGSKSVGLFLSANTDRYTITNSLFIKNGAMAVSLDSKNDSVFDHNTVTLNIQSTTAGGIECKGPRRISNSIVANNANSNESQFLPYGKTATCMLSNTLVYGTCPNPSANGCETVPGATKKNPGLSDDTLLTAEQSDAAIDQATDNTSRDLDYFGTRRPQGPHSDIGFHELVKP